MRYRPPLSLVALLPLAFAALRPVDAADPVDAEREANRRAYDQAVEGLRKDHAGAWVVIAEGKVAATGSSPEEVAKAAPTAKHRYLFRVGDDGDGEFVANFWYGPRFGGLPLAGALGIEAGFGEVTEASPFPRKTIDVTNPSGERASMDVFIGTVGPPLLVTLDDAERLHLERFEVPGRLSASWIPFPFRRAAVRVALPGKGEGKWIVAAVPTGTRTQLAELTRGRDSGWFEDRFGVWAMDPWLSQKNALRGRWVLVGVDRLLAQGLTPAEALKAGFAAAPEAYHRYLTRLPRDEEVVYEASSFTKAESVILNGVKVTAKTDPKKPREAYLADADIAEKLRLELAEDARCTYLVEGATRRRVRAGYAWVGDPKTAASSSEGRVACVLWPPREGERDSWCEPPPEMPSFPGGR